MRKNKVYILIYLSMLLPVLLLTEVLAGYTSHVSEDAYIEFRTKTSNYSAETKAKLKTHYRYKMEEAIREKNFDAALHYQRLIEFIVLKSDTDAESNMSTIESGSEFDFENLSKKSSIQINTEKEIFIKYKNHFIYIIILGVLYIFVLIIMAIAISRVSLYQAKDLVYIISLYSILFGVIFIILFDDLSESSTMLAGTLSFIVGYLLCFLPEKFNS